MNKGLPHSIFVAGGVSDSIEFPTIRSPDAESLKFDEGARDCSVPSPTLWESPSGNIWYNNPVPIIRGAVGANIGDWKWIILY